MPKLGKTTSEPPATQPLVEQRKWNSIPNIMLRNADVRSTHETLTSHQMSEISKPKKKVRTRRRKTAQPEPLPTITVEHATDEHDAATETTASTTTTHPTTQHEEDADGPMSEFSESTLDSWFVHSSEAPTNSWRRKLDQFIHLHHVQLVLLVLLMLDVLALGLSEIVG
jgi:hypothetical protein